MQSFSSPLSLSLASSDRAEMPELVELGNAKELILNGYSPLACDFTQDNGGFSTGRDENE